MLFYTNSKLLIFMKTLKTLGLFLSLTLGLLSFNACNEEGGIDFGTSELPIDNLEIVIPDVIVGANEDLKSATLEEGYSSFSSETVTIGITDGMFAILEPHLGMIKSVKINDVVIRASAEGYEGSYEVKNFTIKSNAFSDFVIPTYAFGDTFSSSNDLNNCIQNAFNSLIKGNDVTFTVSGETNLPVGAKMNYTITLNSVFEVSIKI